MPVSDVRTGKDIVQYCKLLNEKNMLAAADGNVSFRISDKRILITPSGVNKLFLDAADLAMIDIRGKVIRGNPSTEKLLHLEIYRSRPEARCVVHAHPPNAIAWSVAHPELAELPCESLPEVILSTGSVPIVPYARVGTQELADSIHPFLAADVPSKVMILARHGAVSWGESLEDAYNGLERIEHSALILRLAHTLGGARAMDAGELAALRDLRRAKGNRNL
jgi:L-fuculose-phosphate aldolase